MISQTQSAFRGFIVLAAVGGVLGMTLSALASEAMAGVDESGGEIHEGIEYRSAPGRSHMPFSESVRVGNLLFLSGQIGATMSEGGRGLPPGGIGPETRQTLENIRGALERAGLTMNDVVKCTVMLADIAEWADMNKVYRTFFTEHFPARSAFGTSGLALDARVEIECIAAYE